MELEVDRERGEAVVCDAALVSEARVLHSDNLDALRVACRAALRDGRTGEVVVLREAMNQVREHLPLVVSSAVSEVTVAESSAGSEVLGDEITGRQVGQPDVAIVSDRVIDAGVVADATASIDQVTTVDGETESFGVETAEGPYVYMGFRMTERLDQGRGEKVVERGIDIATGQGVIRLQARPGQVAFLRNELSIYRRLEGAKGVLKVIHADVDSPEPFILLEDRKLIPILQLAKGFEREPMKKVEFCTKVLEVMEGIHARQVVRADLKPSHFMVDEEDNVYTIDFGRSHLLGEATDEDGELIVSFSEPSLRMGVSAAEFAELAEVSRSSDVRRGMVYDQLAEIQVLGRHLQAILAGGVIDVEEFKHVRFHDKTLSVHLEGSLKRVIEGMMALDRKHRIGSLPEVLQSWSEIFRLEKVQEGTSQQDLETQVQRCLGDGQSPDQPYPVMELGISIALRSPELTHVALDVFQTRLRSRGALARTRRYISLKLLPAMSHFFSPKVHFRDIWNNGLIPYFANGLFLPGVPATYPDPEQGVRIEREKRALLQLMRGFIVFCHSWCERPEYWIGSLDNIRNNYFHHLCVAHAFTIDKFRRLLISWPDLCLGATDEFSGKSLSDVIESLYQNSIVIFPHEPGGGGGW